MGAVPKERFTPGNLRTMCTAGLATDVRFVNLDGVNKFSARPRMLKNPE
jgi:hypothetical protein